MFSSRTDWNTNPNRLSSLVAAKKLREETILDLTESNPTHCGFSYPKQEIISSLANEMGLSYQPEPRGHFSARKAIAEYYAEQGVAITPEQIILTSSTSEAYSFLFKLLCNVGDEVMVPQPSYPLLEYLCQLNDITLRYYRLAYDGEWHIDFASLRTEFSNRTKAIVLVHPNNPTGSYLKQNEFDQICSLASKHHSSLIADEVFGSYDISPDIHYANILTSQSFVPLFSLNGISKLLGLPQLKLSWIVVDGNLQQRDEALNRLDIIADTFLSVNTPVQVALPKLLRCSSDIRNQIRSRIQTNYRLIQKVFADSSASVLRVEGGWYAILQLPQKYSDDNWAEEILTYQNILVQPGHFFDMVQKSCIVISLLPISGLFDDAILRLHQFIKEK
jgi:aspartate/methionine/tyrosine aminotransferase